MHFLQSKRSFLIIGVIVFCLILALFALVCVPLFDIPLPSFVRTNNALRHFFAWDCLEGHESTFDKEALIKYLEHRDSNRV